MKSEFDILLQTRKNILNIIEPLSLKELNTIPSGFNNNIGWNFIHIAVTQQLLTYGLSSLPFHLEKDIIDAYRKGSKPEKSFSKETFENVKSLFLRLAKVLEEDYKNGKFSTYKAYETSFGFPLNSIEDAIIFNNVHEGLHMGYIMAQKRLIKN